jgi:hypothetical protein
MEAARDGLPAWVPLDIARYESGLDPNNVGDNGTSIGLFQLHRGGLAPASLSDSQLKDPATNARIAIPAMVPAYKQAVNMGLSGSDLLDYVANNSGWPGSLGVTWTRSHRPDYIAGLNNVYAAHAAEDTGAAAIGGVQSVDVQSHYDYQSSVSPVADVFRSISSKEQFESYDQWKSSAGVLEKYNPFAYLMSQGTPIFARALVVIIGLAVIIISLLAIIRPIAEEAAAKAANVEGGAVIV